MSRNFRSRALALASGVALVASGFVAAPAVAGAGDVTLAPSTGLNYGSFANDSFSLENNVTSLLTSTTTSYKITTEEEIVRVTLKQGSTDTSGVTIYGFNALGNIVDLDSIDDTAATDSVNKRTASNALGADDSAGSYIDNLGQPKVASGVFDINLDGLGLAGFVIQQSSFSTTVDSGTGQTETLILQPLKTAGTAYAYGDGSPEPITVQSWVEAEASADYTTVDSNYASPVRTLTWVDPEGVSVIPTIERFVSGATAYLNDDNDSNAILAHSLRFITAGLNLDQVLLTDWDYDVVKADGSALASAEANQDYISADAALRDGFLSHDAAGKIYVKPTLDAALTHDSTYKVIVNHGGDSSAAVDFGSVGFTLPTSGVDYHIEATIDTSDDLAAQTSHTDLGVEVLSGTNARTFTAQIKSADDTAAETASVPVMAIVSYASTYAPGTLTVTGSSEVISAKAGYTMVNGFTDSDGQFELTVTSSTAIKAESYTVDFYVVAEQTAKQLWVNLDDDGLSKDATPVVTYEDSDADSSSLTVTNSVLSGASVTASFTVTDQFGLGTSVDGTKAMQMELKATDIADLKVYADVAADGSVSFTFDNYLGAGESDILTATLFTGTQLAQVSVDTALVTLYNASDVAAVQIPATVSTAITYDDFLSGGAATSAAAPAPNDGNVELKGTVVDANGAGIPGAPVTITGAGLQFVVDGGTKYYTDSITAVANAAGVFNVDVYSHIVNATGATITVTSGASSATTLLKTFLPAATAVDGNVLAFSMDMPANVVMNKTYAVTVTLTDKWGNPIQTKDASAVSALSIQGTGSVQINSSDTATTKNFGKDGKTTVFVRSVKDIAGPGAVVASLKAAKYTGGSLAGSDQAITITEITTDVLTTAWDETVFSNELEVAVEVAETEAGLPAAASGQKVNAGSFKGYVALYALGYEGQRMSAKVGNDWVIVPSIPAATNDLFRAVEFVGAGVEISVRIYIDRVLLTTIPLLTK
jgi:hypothetical protein